MGDRIQYLGFGSAILKFTKPIFEWFSKPTTKSVTKKELFNSTKKLNKKFATAYKERSTESNIKFANDLINRSSIVNVLPKDMLRAAREEVSKRIKDTTNAKQVVTIVDDVLNKQLKEYKEAMENWSYALTNPMRWFKNKNGAFKEVKYDYNFLDAANGVYKATEKSVGKTIKKAAVGAGVAGAAIYGANKLTEREPNNLFALNRTNTNQPQIVDMQQPQETTNQQYSNSYQDDASNYPQGAQDDFDIQDSYGNVKIPKKKTTNSLNVKDDDFNNDVKKYLNRSNIDNKNYFNYTKDNSIINYLSLYHGLYNNA